MVETRVHVTPRSMKFPILFDEHLEGALDAIVDARQEARTQFNGQGEAGVHDRFPGL